MVENCIPLQITSLAKVIFLVLNRNIFANSKPHLPKLPSFSQMRNMIRALSLSLYFKFSLFTLNLSNDQKPKS